MAATFPGRPTGPLEAGAALGGRQAIPGNAVQLLVDGPQTCGAMLEAIAGAQDHVHLESYIVSSDEVGNRFAAALRERAAAGVTVRLIYDAVGSLATPRAWFDELGAAGVEVLEYNPVNPLRLRRRPWQVNARDHRKLLVVDGRTAFVGGVNISGVYACDPAPGRARHRLAHASAALRRRTGGVAGMQAGWRDTHLRVEGPAAAAFQREFLATWRTQGGAPVDEHRCLPPLAVVGDSRVCVLPSAPQDAQSPIHRALESAVQAARERVWITNAYFVPDARLRAALCAAARRGTDVRLILPSQTDSALVQYAGRWHYDALLRAGVRIYERQGAVVHCKTATVDGQWSTVGSSNLDWRSLRDNAELNAIVLDAAFAAQMEALYQDDLRCAREITLTEWRRRPRRQRCAEWGARLLERWL